MRYQKQRLTATGLKELLQTGNRNQYDNIHIIFKNRDELILEDLNRKYYIFELYDASTDIFKDLKESYIYKEMLYDTIHTDLIEPDGLNGNTYDDITHCTAWYNQDQTQTNYTGPKMPADVNVENLKLFFIENKDALKFTPEGAKTKYAGWNIEGIGAKKVMINHNFYTYKELYDIYTGNTHDYIVNKILEFI